MISFEDKLPKYNPGITISSLDEGSFFKYEEHFYQLLYWDKDTKNETYWHCMRVDGGPTKNFFDDICVTLINVTITATSYCERR